ncbi:MAG: M28 family peptidase [Saprospiraceae bacterium]
MIRVLFFFFVVLSSIQAQGKYIKNTMEPPINTLPIMDSAYNLSLNIDTPELKTILGFLASDSCQGRELGKPGIDIAAAYISKKYEEYHIPKVGSADNYYQKVDFKWVSWDFNSINVDAQEYRQIWDYVSVPTDNQTLKIISDSIIFLGYGIDSPNYSDYNKVETNGKIVLIYNGEPKNKKGINLINRKQSASIWSSLDEKMKAAKNHGVKCILIIEEKFKELADQNRAFLSSPTVVLTNQEKDISNNVNVVHLSSSMVSRMFGNKVKSIISARDKINKSAKPKTIYFRNLIEINQIKEVKEIKGNNIMAYIEGSDKKNELVILSAHYDHIGMRGQDIFNGADDNGSGTAGLTQIARTLQIAKDKGLGPRRSVLCLSLTGEEKGLLGSMYYVTDPVFPLSSTIVDVNIDMIGRVDQKYATNSNYVYVIGSDRLSMDLHKANEEVNRLYSHLTLDYMYNAEDDVNRFYYRSDHYNFAEKGIPAIFFFSGVHEDYHRITDDIEKIQFEKYRNIVRHAFLLIWKLANMEKKIELTSLDH